MEVSAYWDGINYREERQDWGFGGDYADAMWRMLQANNSDNYVVVKGEIYTVRNFLTLAVAKLDLDTLVGDASKVWEVLGLKATMSFDVPVGMMVDSELELASQERTLLDAGLLALR